MNNENSEILKQLEIIIKLALLEFYEKDLFLIENDVHEQAIAFRLGIYLNDYMSKNFNSYNLDIEYNRHGEDIKARIYDCQTWYNYL